MSLEELDLLVNEYNSLVYQLDTSFKYYEKNIRGNDFIDRFHTPIFIDQYYNTCRYKNCKLQKHTINGVEHHYTDCKYWNDSPLSAYMQYGLMIRGLILPNGDEDTGRYIKWYEFDKNAILCDAPYGSLGIRSIPTLRKRLINLRHIVHTEQNKKRILKELKQRNVSWMLNDQWWRCIFPREIILVIINLVMLC